MTLFVAKLIGAYTLIMSAWLMLRRDVVLELMERISEEPVAVALVGMVRLAVGLAIVIGHDRWGSGVEIFVSMLGWVILLSGLLTLFLPEAQMRAMTTRLRNARQLPVFALISFALGASLLIGGFRG